MSASSSSSALPHEASPRSSSSGSDFKRECEALVREYFTHGVLADVEDNLKELLGRNSSGALAWGGEGLVPWGGGQYCC